MQRGAEYSMFSARYRFENFPPENRHSFFGTAASSLRETVQRPRLACWRSSDCRSCWSASPQIRQRSRYGETGENALCHSGHGMAAVVTGLLRTARGESRNDVAIVTTFCSRASGGGLRDHSYRPGGGPGGRLPDELHALLRNIAARTSAHAGSLPLYPAQRHQRHAARRILDQQVGRAFRLITALTRDGRAYR